MKKLDVSSISDITRFPVKKGTLQFLQDMHAETLAATIKSLIGSLYDPTVIYVMSGVNNSATYPSYMVTSGSIFYNGEVFDMDATNFTTSAGNVGVFSVIQSQFTVDADPVTFSDTTVRQVHNIRKMQLAQGVSGTGLANFSQLFRLSFTIPQLLNLQLQLGIVGSINYNDNVLQIFGVYPNLSLYVPAPAASNHPILTMGSFNVGDPNININNYNVNFASPLSTANYQVLGSMISNGGADIDTRLVWTIANRLTTGFQLNVKEFAPGVQNVAFEYTIIAK